MEFKKVDIDNTTEEELLSVLKENAKVNRTLKEQIQKMNKATESSEIEIKEIPDAVLVCPETDEYEENVEEDFLDEAEYYISEFKSLNGRVTEESLDEVLPSRSNYNYKDIILRLILELAKDIKDINEIITEESGTLTVEELEVYKYEVISINKTISMLRGRLKENTSTSTKVDKENKLVFTPTPTGNIRVFDELKYVPEEYYEGFLGLFKSIKDGSFKNVRRFENNNKLAGLIEVKDFQIRVAFQRLTKDTYAVVSMFVKKTQRNKGYLKELEGKYAGFKAIADTLKKKANDDEFMKLQKEYEVELFRMLSGEKEDSKGGYTND